MADDACSSCICYVQKDHLIVDCSYVGFSQIPAIPPNVSRLFLNGNNLTYIDSSSFGSVYLRNLRVLRLNNNPISSIEVGSFDMVRHIHTLLLQYTSLNEVPEGLFNDMVHLKWLWLFNSNISYVHPNAFKNLTRLRELYLYSNPLTSLPYGVFQDQAKVKHLYIHDTSLPDPDCCNFCGLRKYADIKWASVSYGSQISCGMSIFCNY